MGMRQMPQPQPTVAAASPAQNPTAGVQTPPPNPDPSAPYRGWYPRWWLLSAILCSVLVGVFTATQPFVCAIRASTAILCQINTWADWRQAVVVAVLWILFLLGWLVSLIFGVGTIEVSRPHRSSVSNILRAMSEFKTINELLYIIGALAFFSIVVEWYLGWYQPLIFGYCSIVVFVGAACFMHRSLPEARRMYLVGAGIFAAFCALIMLWLGPFQPVILASEVIIFISGMTSLFRRSRQPAQNARLTPEQALAAANAKAIAPGSIFMALLYSLFRRNPAPAQGNVNQQGQPPTGP